MNKAINSKKIMALVAIVALVAILGVCLVACNSDSVAKSLEKKEYNVVKLNEDVTGPGAIIYDIASADESFKEGVFASKGKDIVAVIWYNDSSVAEEMETALNKGVKYLNLKVERSGKILYVGTEQGIKDAK